MKKQFQLIEVLSNLRSIRRTGPTIFAGIDPREVASVAEHSFEVSYLCLIFADKVEGVNKGKLIEMALMHDWSEAILGDIPSASKSFQSYFKEDIRSIMKSAHEEALKTLTTDSELDVPQLNEVETKLLLFCDTMCNALEMIQLKDSGYSHKWIKKMFEVQIKYLSEYQFNFVIEVVTELRRMFENGMDNVYLTRATNQVA